MPDLAAFIVNDGQATPVAHTFSPAGITNGVALFEDRASGFQLSYNTATMSLSRPSQTSKTNRFRLKVVVPVLEVLGNNSVSGIVPAPTKAFDLIANVEFVMPTRASTANRADLLAYVRNILTTNGTGVGVGVLSLDPWF